MKNIINKILFVIVLTVVAVASGGKVWSASLTVYDGTATNQYIPMYGFYFDDFTKSECIIPASQLSAMNGGIITAITV